MVAAGIQNPRPLNVTYTPSDNHVQSLGNYEFSTFSVIKPLVPSQNTTMLGDEEPKKWGKSGIHSPYFFRNMGILNAENSPPLQQLELRQQDHNLLLDTLGRDEKPRSNPIQSPFNNNDQPMSIEPHTITSCRD